MQDSNSSDPIYQQLVAAHGHFVADKPDEAEKLCLQALSECDAATQRWLAEYALNMLHWHWRRSEADLFALLWISIRNLGQVPNAREPHRPEMQAYVLNGLRAAYGVKGDYLEALRQFELSIALYRGARGLPKGFTLFRAEAP